MLYPGPIAARCLLALSVGFVAFLAGCSPGRLPTETAARNDPFRPFREIESGILRLPGNPGFLAVRLAAEIDRTSGAATTLVKVTHDYVGRVRYNYDSARNARAEPLRFTVVARYGNCRVRTDCPLIELYKVEVPEADLRTAGAGGYPFKVFAKVGPDVVITLPNDMIAAFVRQLDSERANPTPTTPLPVAQATTGPVAQATTSPVAQAPSGPVASAATPPPPKRE